MNKVFPLIISLLLFSAVLRAQTADTTVVTPPPADSLSSAMSDSLTIEDKEPILPWKASIPLQAERVTGDSLLRWQIWPDWGDFYAYRRDAISYRQGSTGRIDAYHIRGYLPREQQFRMEGISLNNPITGYTNFNLVPHRKIGAVHEKYEGVLRSEIDLRDFYITQPISYLNYDESKFRYRNLEFMVSQNFSERTNLELSYWDRRDGDYYPSDEIQGSQLFAGFYHHLSQDLRIRALVLRNQYDNGEPFGYVVGDPLAFSYSRFSSTPNFSSGRSEFKRLDMVAGIYRRKDSSERESAGVEFSYSRNEKRVIAPGDSIRQDLRSMGLRSFLRMGESRLRAEVEADISLHSSVSDMVIPLDQWLTAGAYGSLSYDVTGGLNITAHGAADHRDDSFSGYEAGVKLNMKPLRWLGLNAGASVFSRIPTMQQLYWDARNWSGNADLENEDGISLYGALDLNQEGALQFGINGRISLVENPILLRADSTFGNAPSMLQGNASVYGRFENHRWEFESSATYQLAEYEQPADPVWSLDRIDNVLRLRNDAFVKGYLFDRATYVKLGVRSTLSPFLYNSRTFNAGLEYWQGGSTYNELPSWFRVDGELSARIRRIMVLIRWENALDGIGQVGYFESAGYPMPPRRLIIGIRAQFRN